MAETLAGQQVTEVDQPMPPAEVAPDAVGEGSDAGAAGTVDADLEKAADDADVAAPSDGFVPAGRNGQPSEDLLVQEGDVAGDYLERLLDVVDYDGDIDLDVEGDRAVVSIDGGADLEKLVGSRGAVLEALQELTRLAVQQQTGVRSRLMLDIAQWRSARRSELSELGRATAERVCDSGEPARLQPMTPFERKIVHDAVASVDGVYSESEGEEPRRRVVVFRST
ncbi:MAG: protein jag [Pseudonocardiaceae bacterium]